MLRRLGSLPRRRLLIVIALVLAGLGYGSLAAGLRLSSALLPGNAVRLPGPAASLPGLTAPTTPPGRRTNFLILGVDHRNGVPNTSTEPGQANAPDYGRSDTMAVLSVDPASKTAVLLSIPRDLWLEVPNGRGGWTLDRINEAFYTGEADHLPGGGGQAAADAVTHNFGIPIDYYVVIDFKGFIGLVDALGGIDLNVPQTITATILPKNNSGGYEYTFFAGEQHLNGELALGYARFRYDPQGDLGRILRQQAVAVAARDKALSLGWLSVTRAPSLWDRYNATVDTNLPAYKVPGYALLAKQIEDNGIGRHSLGEPGATREVILPSGADVLLPDPSIVARIIGDAFDDTHLRDITMQRLSLIYPTLNAMPPLHAPQLIPTGSPSAPSVDITP